MKPKASLRPFLALSGTALFTISHAHAASGDWTYDGGTAANLLWSSATSWSSNPTVPGTTAGDVINFTNNITAARQITIDSSTTRTVGTLTIGDSNNTHGFTIAAAGSGGTLGKLVLDNGASAAVLTENGSIADSISAPITLNSNLNATANGSLSLGSVTAASKTITKLGAGRLVLTANNGSTLVASNTFDVQAGTLSWGNASGLGAATINLNGGNLDAESNQGGQTAGNNVMNWNQNWTWVGSASTFSLGTGAVTLGANGGNPIQVTVSANQLTVGGVIGDTGVGRGLTKAGVGTLVLGGANTYTGATTVNGGVLRLANNTSLAGGIGASGGTSALILNGGVVELAANNFSRNLGSGASQFQITGGTSGFSSFAGQHNVVINNDASQEVQWGGANFAPTTLVLNDATANDTLVFQNKLDLNGTTRTVNVNANTAVISGDIRTSSGTAGLTKGGSGTLVLSGTNTYTGPTTVNAGVLSVAVTANLPGYTSPGNIVFGGGTVRVAVGGTGWTTGNVDTLLSNATKTSGAIGLDTSSGNLTQWTAFTTGNLGGLGLNKHGSNTLTLDQVNSYTGATTLSGGTLKIQNSTGLAQTLGSLSVVGPDVTLVSDYNGGSGTLSTTFGSFTRATGSTVNFSVTGGTNGTTNMVKLTGGQGFISGGAYFGGADFAALSGTNGYVRALAYGTDANTSATVNTLTNAATFNGWINTSYVAGANWNQNSLKIDGAAGGTWSGAALFAGSILKTGGGNFTVNTNLRGQNGDIVIRTNGSTDQLTVTGTDTAMNLTKSGAGTLTFTTSTTHLLNNIYVNGGTLEFSGAGSISNAVSPIFIISGATFLYNSTTAKTISGGISGGGNFTKNNTSALILSAPNSFSGTTTVLGGTLRLGNTYALQNSTLDTAASTANTLQVVSLTSVTLGGLSGNKDFSSATGGMFTTTGSQYAAVTALTLNPGAGVTNDYSGGIANGAIAMTLTKTGMGTQILSGTSTYTGATNVNQGALVINGNISTSALTKVSSGATLGGSGTVGNLTIDSGGYFSPGNSPGITTVNGDYIQNGQLIVEIDGLAAGNGSGFHDQVLVNGTVTLNGALNLSSFTGFTPVNGDLIFILLNDGNDAISGTFTGLAQGSVVGSYLGFDWQISYTGNSGGNTFTGGNDVVLMAVPEPRAALLGGIGLFMLLRRRRN